MTFFLQRLAERAMGRHPTARLVRTPYIAHSLAVTGNSASFPSPEPISPQTEERPSAAKSHTLVQPPEAAAEFLAPASLAAPGRTFFDQVPFAERSVFSALPATPAPFAEPLIANDNRQPVSDGENDSPGRHASRHPKDDDRHNLSGEHGVTGHPEKTALKPVDAKNPWQRDPRMEAAAAPPSRLGEDRLMPMHRIRENGTDHPGENHRGLPGEIEPLLPLSRLGQEPEQTAVSLSSSGRNSRSATTEPNTEIHVTIGRVEVTALSPKQEEKPTRQAAQRRPPMSLDEYLAKRHGRAS